MTTDARETAGTGISGFVGAHALHDDAQREAADRVRRTVEKSDFYRGAFGDAFVDYVAMMKRAELARFQAATPTDADSVTAWEMDEYFEAH